MTKRIFKAILAVALSMLLLCTALIIGVLYEYFGNQFSSQLASSAAYIAQGVENEGMSYFENLHKGSSRITWVDKDGTVIYDSIAEVSALENHKDREEIKQAFENSTGKSYRYSNTLAEKTLNYAVKLKDGSVLRVSSSQYSIFMLILGMLQPILIILIIVVTLSGAIAYKVSKQVVKPINEIDLEHPEYASAYEELTPFLRRITYQNRQIKSQMDELRRQQQEFSTITENMSEGFLIIDSKTNILSHNSSALKLLDVNGEVGNQSVLTLNRSEEFRKAIDSALKGEHNQQKMRINHSFYHIFANPVYQGDNLVGAVLVIMDITEKEERENLRREFTANVSHELKTPLTSISGFAEIIKNGIAKQEDIPGFAVNIYNEAQRLITLVEDIIKLSQLDENSVPFEKEPVDLLQIVYTVSSYLRPAAEKRNISLDIEGQPVQVLGVSKILEEMVYNLCDNAIKYNKDKGKVCISLSEERGAVKLTVSDTGIGIPYSLRERVFERFYRVDKSHSKEIGGTGLGLSIVKHGAAFHGASIYLKSKPDKGTVITINFPPLL